jgi:NitT/TauT family transport system substrate-binding protein
MGELVRIGYLSTLYHTSHLLRQLRWVEEEIGAGCRWLLHGTGPEMIDGFLGGDIDIGYLGLPPALIAMARGVPLVCVAGGHVEGTVMVAGPPYRSLAESDDMHSFLEQFRHRRVGVPSAGSIHDVIFRALLMDHCVSEVEILNYSWADLIPYFLNKGEIEAAVGTPPLAVLCERECGTRTVIPPGALWPFSPSYGIVIRKGMLKEESVIEEFLRLHEEACNLIRDLPERAARLTVSALPGLDERFVLRVYAVSPKYCASLPEPYRTSTLGFLPVMERLGYWSSLERPSAIFEPRFIEKVHPGPHHYSSR